MPQSKCRVKTKTQCHGVVTLSHGAHYRPDYQAYLRCLTVDSEPAWHKISVASRAKLSQKTSQTKYKDKARRQWAKRKAKPKGARTKPKRTKNHGSACDVAAQSKSQGRHVATPVPNCVRYNRGNKSVPVSNAASRPVKRPTAFAPTAAK